jgi:hypothetical protein
MTKTISYIPRLFCDYGFPAVEPKFIEERIDRAKQFKEINHTKKSLPNELIEPFLEPYLVPRLNIFICKRGKYRGTRISKIELFFCRSGYEAMLPTGVFSKLLISWICTELKKDPSCRTIELPAKAKLLRTFGINRTGEYHNRISDSMENLLSAEFGITDRKQYDLNNHDIGPMLHYATSEGYEFGAIRDKLGLTEKFFKSFMIAEDYRLWNPKRPSYVTVTEEFQKLCLETAIPIYQEDLASVRGSSLKLDFYLWLVSRVINGHHISPEELRLQFGYGGSKSELVRTLKHAHKGIQKFWDVDVEFVAGQYVTPALKEDGSPYLSEDGVPLMKGHSKASLIRIPKQASRVPQIDKSYLHNPDTFEPLEVDEPKPETKPSSKEYDDIPF